MNLNALAGIGEELRELAESSLFIAEARAGAPCKALCGRVERLPEDVAYSGADVAFSRLFL